MKLPGKTERGSKNYTPAENFALSTNLFYCLPFAEHNG